MPTILRQGPYRVYFFSHEPNEPPHVHIDRDNQTAKFWLDPPALASGNGYSPGELKVLHKLVVEHLAELLRSWNGYFGVGGG